MIIIFFSVPVYLCMFILGLIGGAAIYMGKILLLVAAIFLVLKVLLDHSLRKKIGMALLVTYILADVLYLIPPFQMVLARNGTTLWDGLCALTLSLSAVLLMLGGHDGDTGNKKKLLALAGVLISMDAGILEAAAFYFMKDVGTDLVKSIFPLYAVLLIAFPVGMLLQLIVRLTGNGDALKAETPWVTLLAAGALIHALLDLNTIMLITWGRIFFGFPFMRYIPPLLAIVCLIRLIQLDPALWQSLMKLPEKKKS